MPSATIANYHDAVAFLMGRINYERVQPREDDLGLQRMVQLLDRCGNPHHGKPIIHLAGTKGKGSTAAMLSHLLSNHPNANQPLQVGLYTSPHLVRIEERLRINGAPCTEEQFVDLAQQVANATEAMDASGDAPTFFELSTAMALLHFCQQRVDIIVLETGLGGRLDSTNIVDPLLSIITSISLDHTRLLGDTHEKIAYEKCGIIKPARPVVSGIQSGPAQQVVRQTCHERGSPLYELGRDFHITDVRLEQSPPATAFQYQSPSTEACQVQLGLLGKHQAANAALAIAVLDLLRTHPILTSKLGGWTLPAEADVPGWLNSLVAARWPARIECVRQQPPVVLDVAHNVASANALIETLDGCFPSQQQRILVLAVSRDKDVQGIVAALAPHFTHIVVTQFHSNPRSVSCEKLASLVEPYCADNARQMTIRPLPVDALNSALANPSDAQNTLVCIAGSFFLAAELRDVLSSL